MPVKDSHESCCFFVSPLFVGVQWTTGRGKECNVGTRDDLCTCAFKVPSLPGPLELPQCTWVLVWGKHRPWTGAMRVGVGSSGVGVKGREDMIHGSMGSSRDTAADLQSEGCWTGTRALFRQSERSVSCDGWRRSVWEPLSRCVSRSHLQASTVNRDQMADARGPSGTCALRHTNDYGCRPINGHICKGEQQPAHWEWVSGFNSPLEHRHAGVNVGIKPQLSSVPGPIVNGPAKKNCSLALFSRWRLSEVYLLNLKTLTNTWGGF